MTDIISYFIVTRWHSVFRRFRPLFVTFYRPLAEALAGAHRTLRFRGTRVDNHWHGDMKRSRFWLMLKPESRVVCD